MTEVYWVNMQQLGFPTKIGELLQSSQSMEECHHNQLTECNYFYAMAKHEMGIGVCPQ
jgi:hypothetical protein